MKYGICHLSVVPCRLEPADTSEMVTQLLFGDIIKVYEEKKGNWSRIKTVPDNYDCWIDTKQFTTILEEEFNAINSSPLVLCNDVVSVVKNTKTKELTPIVLGSSLPHFKKNNFHFANLSFGYEGSVIKSKPTINKNKIAENAYLFLNAPYLWGGRSPFGIDCSGFTQIIYKLNGINLPRNAAQQAEIGQTLSFIEESESGDLAFFDNVEGNIIHVGIMLENNRIIHASGKVRIDKIDHQGIFNVDSNNYSHRLRLIKKIL